MKMMAMMSARIVSIDTWKIYIDFVIASVDIVKQSKSLHKYFDRLPIHDRYTYVHGKRIYVHGKSLTTHNKRPQRHRKKPQRHRELSIVTVK
jgi:hypothetical protein